MPLNAQDRLAMRRRLYPGIDEAVFGAVQHALDQHIGVGAAVLDAGSGTGTWVLEPFASRIRLLVGADIEPPTPQTSTSPVLTDVACLPFADASFNVVLCYNVIEHLADPAQTFRDIARVLVPGGAFLFKTPNLTAPITILSRVAPLALRRRIKGGLGVGAEHVFGTYYRCNTAGALQRSLQDARLQRETLVVVDQTYDYLYFTRLTYALGLAYSRMVGLRGLGWARNSIIGVYTKALS